MRQYHRGGMRDCNSCGQRTFQRCEECQAPACAECTQLETVRTGEGTVIHTICRSCRPFYEARCLLAGTPRGLGVEKPVAEWCAAYEAARAEARAGCDHRALNRHAGNGALGDLSSSGQ